MMNTLQQRYQFLADQASQLTPYIIAISVMIIASYSVFFVFDPVTVEQRFGHEDSLFESLTAICFLLASVFALLSFLNNRNFFFLLLALVFFVGAGEEVSWGQRIFDFETPETISEVNVQNEFNLHNIEVFNARHFDKSYKQGLAKLLTITFLYKLFWLTWCVVLPLIVMNSRAVRALTERIKLPIPPLLIGVFFIVNWGIYKLLHSVILPRGEHIAFYAAAGEIRESLSAVIFLALMVYFYRSREATAPGASISAGQVSDRSK